MKKFEYKFEHNQRDIKYIKENICFNKYKEEDTIFQYLIDGYTGEQISNIVGLSERTIMRRRKELYNKIEKCLLNRDNSTLEGEIILDDIAPLHKRQDYCVYALVFPNHKMYIGQTKNTEKRWRKGHGYQSYPIMYEDIIKYGWDNIIKCVVYKNLSYIQAIEKEKELTLLYRTNEPEFGYNRIVGNGGKR